MPSSARKRQHCRFAVIIKPVRLQKAERDFRIRKAFEILFDELLERQIQGAKQSESEKDRTESEAPREG